MAERCPLYQSRGFAIRFSNDFPLSRMHPGRGIKITIKHLHEVKGLCFGDGTKGSNACGIQLTN